MLRGTNDEASAEAIEDGIRRLSLSNAFFNSDVLILPMLILSVSCMRCTTLHNSHDGTLDETNQPSTVTDEERIYLQSNIDSLGVPGIDNDAIEQWRRVIDITARSNDVRSAKKITNVANYDLDGSYTSHYTYHLFQLFSKNPRLFFVAALESFKSIEGIASFLVTEAGIVTSSDIATAIDAAPMTFRDEYNSKHLLDACRSIEPNDS